MWLMSYTKEEEFVEGAPNVNPVLAAFTTAQARLKLFSYLHPLGARVLYFDTDSIIYVSRPGDSYEVPVGNFLGEMTDELEGYGPGSYISEFVSAGPKNYAYEVTTPGKEGKEHCVKVKGFTLDNQAAQLLNFETMKEMVRKYVEEEIRDTLTINQSRIGRTVAREVVTFPQTKRYKVVYDKRAIRDGYVTYPYGYLL
jgi:hypothetical protein